MKSDSSVVRCECVGGGKIHYTMTTENGGYSFSVSSSLFDEEYSEKVNDVTTKREIADSFFELLVRNLVTPCSLKEVAEDFVAEIYSLNC